MTSPQPPADQAVRDQVVSQLDTSFFLEAGAGSGKTSVLVDRVVNLVRHGRTLAQIVAITFTEKAAGELRERIRAELSAAAFPAALQQLRELDAAPIQTIHSFCAHLLHEYAIDAELDPDFTVLDQLQTDLRFAQSWQSWLWGADSPRALLQRALDLHLTLPELHEAATHLSRHRDLLGMGDSPNEEEEEAKDADDDELPPEQQARDQALADLLPHLQDFVEADAAQRRADGVLSYDDLLLETRNLLVRDAELRAALRERYRAVLIDEFQDTDPLQAEIALLLAAEPDTAEWTEALPGPGRLVLCGDPKQSIYRFRRADIDIYEQVRERFIAASALEQPTAALAALTVNFRARPQLCAWQNAVLPHVVRPDRRYERAQARWEDSVPHRIEPNVGVAVIPSAKRYRRAPEARRDEARLLANLIVHLHGPDSLFGPPLPYRDLAVLLRTRTAAAVYTNALDAAAVPYHFDSGQGFYQQPEIRAVAQLLLALDDPADAAAAVAVLKSPLAAASDVELHQLHTALDGAPLRLDGQHLPPSYVGRLRQPIEELSALRAELRGLSLPELVDRVIRDSGLLPAQAVGASGPRRAAMRQRQANLRMLVQRAAHFAEQEDDSLRPFARWLSQRGVRNLPESESPTTEADEDAVRILTIHQAKGLEFPVVILPKLQDAPGGWDGRDFLVDRARQRLEFRLGDDRTPFRTPGYVASLPRDHAYRDAEARRLLYVAATRARDWLILPAFAADSLGDRDLAFHRFLDDAAPYWKTADADPFVHILEPRRFDAAPQPQPLTVTPPLAELQEAWEAQRAAALSGGTRRFQTRTPSTLYPSDAPEPGPDDAEQVEEPDAPQPAFDPLDFGSAVHEALEAADFANWEVTQQRTERICARLQLPAEPILAHVQRALQSDLLQQASRSRHVHRELPLTQIVQRPLEDAEQGEQGEHENSTETVITEGVADLLFQDPNHPDGWVLVDYKSDRDLPPERQHGYRRQLNLYAALLRAAGVEVARAYLLLTASGEAVPVPLDEPSAD